jgi:multiple sugar transport system ATP-binding protein
MSSVELKSVNKRFGDVHVIQDLDLKIVPGEFTVFVGPSGCGKSTLLRMIAGLEEITDGALSIDGQIMNDVQASQRGIAMVFQSYALYPHMNVYKNMAFALETAKAPRAEIEARVGKAAKILQIEHLLTRKPKQLSGGQRQRVAIGRAIVRDPKIFLFDEPLSNLDAELRVQMRVEIAKLHRELGTTMIYVTHDQVEAMTMADKIVVLRAGRVEQVGSPLTLYNTPANQFVAGFIGNPKMNLLKGMLVGSDAGQVAVEVAGTRIVLDRPLIAPHQGAITFGVRPEHMIAAEAGGVSLGTARVQVVEQLGGETLLYAELSDGQPVTVKLEGQKSIHPGETVDIHFNQASAHVFKPDGIRIA